MAPKNKINLKDRCENGELDLSMSDLQEVPVKEIATMKKATSLDLSNNRLTTLGKTFISLTHIVKLDLSKNLLQELPEDFGEMRQLKHLDLYSNQLTHLPLSFCDLRSLRWLDLKNNPLVPAVAKIAGPCLVAQQCQQSARDVVAFFAQMKEQVEEEKLRRQAQQDQDLEAEAQHSKAQQKKRERKKAAKAKKNNKNKIEKKEEATSVSGNGAPCHEDAPAAVASVPASKGRPVKRKSGFIGSVLRCMLYMMCGSMLLGFLLSAAKLEPGTSLRQRAASVWNGTLDKLPESSRPVLAQLAGCLDSLHTMTGRLVDNVCVYVGEARQNEHVNGTLSMLADGLALVFVESGKMLRTLSDKAVIISDEIRKKIV